MTKRRFIALYFLVPVSGFGQWAWPEVVPARGVVPTGSYTSSETDAVDNVNGNLSLTIPLAQLPRGRAGSTFTLGIHYDSAIYDLSRASVYLDSSQGASVPGQALVPSSTGGWHYTFQGLQLIADDRTPAVPSVDSCAPLYPHFGTFQLRLSLPDGSIHKLYRQRTDLWDDAWDVYDASGIASSSCSTTYSTPHPSPTSLTWPITYYTADGTFLKVVRNDPYNFIVYFPDGTKLLNYGFSPSQYNPNGNPAIAKYDANGNATYFAPVSQTLANGAIVPGYDIYYGSPGPGILVFFYGGYDTITALGQNGSTLTTTVNYATVSISSGSWGCVTGDSCTLGSLNHPVGHRVVTSIVPPVLQQMTFSYMSTWGELSSFTTALGATVNYGYFLNGHYPRLNIDQSVLGNSVTSKMRTATDAASENWTWTYTPQATSSTGTTELKRPDGSKTLYTYGSTVNPHISGGLRGLVTQVKDPDGAITSRAWSQNLPLGLSGAVGSPTFGDPGNPYVSSETLTLSSGAATTTTYGYDKNGNLTSETENAFSSETDPPSSRTSTLQYWLSAPSASANPSTADTLSYWTSQASDSTMNAGPRRRVNAIRRLDVSGGNQATLTADPSGKGPFRSITEFAYDDYTSNGNITVKSTWDSTLATAPPAPGALNQSNSVTLAQNFDTYGNLVSQNGAAIPTIITYDTSGVNPVSVMEGTQGYFDGQKRTQTHDTSSGLLTQEVDTVRGVTTAFSYDFVGRLKTRVDNSGASPSRQTGYSYDDVNRVVTVSSDLVSLADGLLWSATYYDQFGRVKQVRTTDGGTPTAPLFVDSIWRYPSGGGTEVLMSNPYRSSSDSTVGWTCKVLDGLGRVTSVSRFSGSAAPASGTCGIAGTTNLQSLELTSYTDRLSKTVTDPNGNQVTYKQDRFGRLVQVTQTTDHGAEQTGYKYDHQGLLRLVTQDSQTRTFQYSSAGLLYSATNPESGTQLFSYDARMRLQTKTLASGKQVTYTYDALNRLLTEVLPEGTVTYGYYSPVPTTCLATQPLGSSYNGNLTRYLNYDCLGRITTSSQNTAGDSQTRYFSYSYYLNDAIRTTTYPSNRVITYGYDNAGRLSSVADLAGGKTYLTTTGVANPYTPAGQPAQYKLGNGLWETRSYDSLLRLGSVSLGTSAGSGNRFQDVLQYRSDGSLSQQTVTEQDSTSRFQNYYYDGANRIQQINEGGAVWRTFGYDRWANMYVASAPGFATQSTTPTTPSWFNTSTNRIVSATYDADGNITANGAVNYGFDTKGRMTSSTVNSSSTTFVYDGDGHRVSKTSGGQTTVYVYDIFDQLAAEYGAGATASTRYLMQDHLGSTRVVTDGSGSVISRHDFLPFGEEIPAGVGARGALWGAVDNVTQRFTGKERDAETGLDYLETRYFSGAQGRFTSPDAPFGDQHASDPQSWNLYTYSRNNPLRYNDPTGGKCVQTNNGQADDGTGGGCEAASVDAKGNIAPQRFTATESGLLLTQEKGIIYSLGDNGSRTPVAEQGLQEASLELLPAIGLGRAALGALEGAGARGLAGSIRNVNPTGGTLNCANCAIATDATLAGRAASALPGGATPIAVLEQQFGGQFVKVSGQQAIESTMQAAGSGARAIVFGERAGGIGHVFNVVNQNGAVRFLDGQTGRAASFAGYTGFRLLRTN